MYVFVGTRTSSVMAIPRISPTCVRRSLMVRVSRSSITWVHEANMKLTEEPRGGGGGGGGSRGWKDRGALRGRCQCRRRWRSALSGGAPSDKSCWGRKTGVQGDLVWDSDKLLAGEKGFISFLFESLLEFFHPYAIHIIYIYVYIIYIY